MCTGGNTSLPIDFHRDVCGVCFGRTIGVCRACASGVLDACGVCNGNNATCTDCMGIVRGTASYDICGVCGGQGETCLFGCDGVLGSGLRYDCARVCNGTNTLDSCGVCAGPQGTISRANELRDTCGVCFGGNRDRDICGVCFGKGADLDSCRVCGGGDSAVDACGVCFGSNRQRDRCGVCFGNWTNWCFGCDGNPHSGYRINTCGECARNGDRESVEGMPPRCDPRLGTSRGMSLLAVLLIATCAVLLCAVALASLLYMRRLRARRARIGNDEAAALLAKAPSGFGFLALTDIEGSTALWEREPERMDAVLDLHNQVMRSAIADAGGFEYRTEGDAFFVAFATAADAVRFGMLVQGRLLDAPWPDWLLQVPGCEPVPLVDARTYTADRKPNSEVARLVHQEGRVGGPIASTNSSPSRGAAGQSSKTRARAQPPLSRGGSMPNGRGRPGSHDRGMSVNERKLSGSSVAVSLDASLVGSSTDNALEFLAGDSCHGASPRRNSVRPLRSDLDSNAASSAATDEPANEAIAYCTSRPALDCNSSTMQQQRQKQQKDLPCTMKWRGLRVRVAIYGGELNPVVQANRSIVQYTGPTERRARALTDCVYGGQVVICSRTLTELVRNISHASSSPGAAELMALDHDGATRMRSLQGGSALCVQLIGRVSFDAIPDPVEIAAVAEPPLTQRQFSVDRVISGAKQVELCDDEAARRWTSLHELDLAASQE